MPGESSSKESIPSSTWKHLIAAVLGLGIASVMCVIVAILMLMYLSYGNEMWPILLRLKTGIIP